MTTDLTKISGIGRNSAKALIEAGFDSIETIAKSTPEALGKVNGFGPKRAERIIASAKELVQDAEPTPVVEPVVAAAKTSHFASRGRSRTFFASAAVLLLLLAAVVYFGYQNGFGDFAPFQTAKEDTTNDANGQAAMRPGQKAMNGSAKAGDARMAGQRTAAPGQNPMAGQPPMPGQRPMNGAGNREFVPMSAMPQNASAMQRQANQPDWVVRQRAQADAQAEMHRAHAEKFREESWNRFVASLPPAQAEQATRHHEIAMRRMEESKKRHEAMVQQHNAYMNQRFGG